MGEQLIVTIGRQYGSGGHEIAEHIARTLNIAFYDRGMLEAVAKSMNLTPEDLEKYDEKPINYLLTRRVGGHSNSVEEIVKERQIEEIKKRADAGESFVLVGRCGNQVLKDYPGAIHIFLKGDKDLRIRRIMKLRGMSKREATAAVKRHDRYRRMYHERETATKWGSAKYYDMCLNATQLGIKGCADVLVDYINERRKYQDEEGI